MEIIGDAKISTKKMIRIPNSLMEILELEVGDNIVFQKNDRDEIVIKKGKVVIDSE